MIYLLAIIHCFTDNIYIIRFDCVTHISNVISN